VSIAPSRQAAEKRGHWGERRAAWWLRLHGWRILAQRVRVPAGEIDIVAKRGGIVAFVEVKTRTRADDLDLAIDARTLRRVVAAVDAVGHIYAPNGEGRRIDAILIAPRRLPRHMVNVWDG
jgi:putative endonuclease